MDLRNPFFCGTASLRLTDYITEMVTHVEDGATRKKHYENTALFSALLLNAPNFETNKPWPGREGLERLPKFELQFLTLNLRICMCDTHSPKRWLLYYSQSIAPLLLSLPTSHPLLLPPRICV